MDPVLKAAADINAPWHRCMKLNGIVPVGCPSDEDVAQIIRSLIRILFPQEPQA